MKPSEVEEIAFGKSAIIVILLMGIVGTLIVVGLVYAWGELAGLPVVW